MKEGKLRKKFLKRSDKKSKVGIALTRLGRVFHIKKFKAEKS